MVLRSSLKLFIIVFHSYYGKYSSTHLHKESGFNSFCAFLNTTKLMRSDFVYKITGYPELPELRFRHVLSMDLDGI